MNSGLHERRAEPALADWTRRLAEGDDEAWCWFHQRYYLSLLRYAGMRAGNPSVASEVVQQAYLRIARHIRPFAEEADFWGWLCCVVRCAAVDYGRNVIRRTAFMEKYAHWRAARGDDDAEWHPSGNRASALADEALAKLSPDDAALLRGKYCDGCTTQDLATQLGTTTKTVENRLARLRERLREIILRIR
jgi:RNA polymerase sigma factor (sigma-70 family)